MKRLRASEKRQAFLLKLSDALRSEALAEAMIATGTRMLGERLRASRVVFAEIDDAAGLARIRQGWPAAGSERHPPTLRLADFGAPLLDDLRAGRAVRYDDVGKPPYARPDLAALAATGMRAGLSVPLVVGGRLVLNIDVHQHAPRRWTDDEVTLVEDVAERIWAAVIRARAEQALRESEGKYRTLFETIDEGFAVIELVLDEDGTPVDILHLEANPAYERHAGVRDVVGKRGSDILPDMGELIGFYAGIARSGEAARIERYIEPFDRWLTAHVSRIGGEGSLRLAVVFNDVTDRRRAEEALRDSERQQHLVVELVPAMLWWTDRVGERITLNARWLSYTGQTAEETQDFGWLAATHPDDLDATRSAFGHAFASGEPLEREQRIRRADGEYRWHQIRHVPVRDDAGSITRWFGAAVDIHENKLARQALDRSERLSRALVEGVPQLVWRAVDGGDFTWASPQWTAFTGQAEAASHGHGWLETVHPDDRDGAIRLWHDAEGTGRLEIELRLRHGASGRYRWFQTRAMPVRAADGTIAEWLGTSTDVDDLRRMQDRQRILLGELQHRVRNVLTIVRSVFTRTAETDAPLDQIIEHFRGRLDNLARTQVVLTTTASGRVDLRSLIFDELLSVGSAENPNVVLEGPDIALDSRTAESIGLAVHELTTNALKYGALKVTGARLSVRWLVSTDDGGARTLEFRWTEQGVPVVPLTPARQGFGSELIQEALPYRLGARTKLEFRGGGVRCLISVPLSEDTVSAQPWDMS